MGRGNEQLLVRISADIDVRKVFVFCKKCHGSVETTARAIMTLAVSPSY